jgi:hypothetical protein
MFCAFDGKPNIVRLYGHARIIPWDHPGSEPLRSQFPSFRSARSIVEVDVHRVSTSCGYGVPVLRLDADRAQLLDWAERKGDAGLRAYWRDQNAMSIDELPALSDPA